MPIRTLAEVAVRLEEAVKALSSGVDTPSELYERYEMIAIEILDSNFDSFPDGVLEEFLRDYLSLKEKLLIGQ
ncbi:hypothetical protein [Marinobacterium rhizophilum]|uniref:hypothetical protein n=1 Tax=Marinobacterium rhizophilum TaxID=420402 RepID=UPI00037C275E|nr:hypothetical protein [Marinobacterium rhizophilum]